MATESTEPCLQPSQTVDVSASPPDVTSDCLPASKDDGIQDSDMDKVRESLLY